MTVGELVKSIRGERSRLEFARYLGITQQGVYMIKTGKSRASTDILELIAKGEGKVIMLTPNGWKTEE